MDEITRENLMEEPQVRTLTNMDTVWVFKAYVSSPFSQIPVEETFRYKQHMYQVKEAQIISATPENYIQAYCLQVGVFPP